MPTFNNYEKPSLEPIKHHDGTCPSVGYQHVAVSVPVAVIPYARVDKIKIHCLKETIVKQGESHCKGKKDGICCLTLSQTFCVEIPVSFGASVELGDTFVDCLGASTKNALSEMEDEE